MGKLLIFSAPSGSGKTTIIRELLKRNNTLAFSISATSRSKRGVEIDGRDYYFLSADVFRQKVDNQEFVEWEEVYENRFYGTLHSELERLWSEGKHVVFDVDVQGGLNIKKQFGERALAIFVQPPSIMDLEQRLRSRGTDSEEEINRRLKKAAYELGFASHFDVVLVNQELEKAIDQAHTLVSKFLNFA